MARSGIVTNGMKCKPTKKGRAEFADSFPTQSASEIPADATHREGKAQSDHFDIYNEYKKQTKNEGQRERKLNDNKNSMFAHL